MKTELKTFASISTFCAALAGSTIASAAELIGPRKIADLGCHNGDGICYVTLEGAPFGGSLGCANAPVSQFRFDNGDTSIGRRAYASFLAAFLAGKQVTVSLEGCTSQGAPRLVYFHLLN